MKCIGFMYFIICGKPVTYFVWRLVSYSRWWSNTVSFVLL